uniref:Oxidored_FMN domain-containing protein n=1 Tax=Caenorhabditis japonica TaxID=281687 RepID=A0A8R1I4B1_CAEJA
MKRFCENLNVSPAILGEHLKFRSGRETQNRFLKAALTERVSTYDVENPKKHGLPTDYILNLYDKWGHGKFGTILTGNVLVDPTNLESAGNAIIFKEGDGEERRSLFSQWAKNIKQDGALAVVQLSHGGRQTPVTVEQNPWSASDVQLAGERRFTPFGKPVPLTVEQIKTEVIDRFVFAAKFAYETGFDGVELHAAHGYLLAQFTSPTTNKRTDQYGGSIANRQRIILEIYDAIREVIPASTGFLVGIKTNSVEFQEQGTTVDDAKEMCQVYEEKGFDFVELSGGTYEKLAFHHLRDSTRSREAFFLEFAEKIRPVFKNTVVYLTGGFRTVKAMVEAIENGATQGIGLGRPITAEPDLPKKILEGSVASSIKNALDENDFGITNLVSNTQMQQMGRTTFQQAEQKPTYGISDFSDEATVQRYNEALKDYVVYMKTLAGENKPIHGVLVFEGVQQA